MSYEFRRRAQHNCTRAAGWCRNECPMWTRRLIPPPMLWSTTLTTCSTQLTTVQRYNDKIGPTERTITYNFQREKMHNIFFQFPSLYIILHILLHRVLLLYLPTSTCLFFFFFFTFSPTATPVMTVLGIMTHGSAHILTRAHILEVYLRS